MPDPDLSVVVPVYNNAATLDELVTRLVEVLEPLGAPFELIFVDDGSKDASLAILQERAASDGRIRVYAMARNFGSQAAACAGFDLVRGRRAVIMDADLENRPEDLPALLEPLDRGYDMVCGYREQRNAPWLSRQLPSRLINAYVRWRTGATIRDVACGMRSFQSWVIRDLAEEGEARRLLTPVFLRRARHVAEIPIRPGVGRPEASGHSFLTLLGIAADYFILTAGRPFLVSGVLSGGAVAAGIVVLAAGHGLPGLVVLATGLVGMLLSLVGEYCQHTYWLAQRLPFYQLRDTSDERVIDRAYSSAGNRGR